MKTYSRLNFVEHFRSETHHEWKGFYVGIGAIHNQRRNQIQIFSTAGLQREQEEKLAQNEKYFRRVGNLLN